MFFQIESKRLKQAVSLGAGVKGVTLQGVEKWHWVLYDGTPATPAKQRAVSADRFDSEAAARSDVAAFRKSASGVKFAKVVTP